MSAIFSIPELALGIGLSEAASAAFEPKVEVPKQGAWANNPQRLPDVGLIAALVAGGKVSQTDGRSMARRLGFDTGPFDSMTWIAQNRLDFPLMLRLWRRFGAFDPGADAALAQLVDETLAHEQLDWDYHPWLTRLKTAELVGLGDIAAGIVRSALPAPSYVPVPAPTSGLTVPRFPQVNIDPEQLAAAIGFDKDMLQLMVARSGLSLAPGLAATALFRGEINDNDFLLAIAEGDLRTEWAQTLKDASRAIPSPHDFVQKHLRGWTDAQGMYDGAARHGMKQPDVDTLYQIERRPLTPHQIKQALARGANFNPEPGEIQDPYTASVHQNNLGPEWYEMAVSLQASYPSLFITNRLVTSGIIDATTGADWIRKSGEADEVVTAMEDSWSTSTGTTGTKADPHVAKAQVQVWTATHKAYVDALISAQTATASLGAAGVAAAAIPTVLAAWQVERDLIRKSLSAGQIKKAWAEQIPDPATGQPWTKAEAVARLQELGYTADDAAILLVE